MGIPWTVGADPEFFLHLVDDPISAHDMLPGTKKDPFPLYKGALQVDGTAAEFNIEPASTVEDFQANIMTVLGQIRQLVDPAYTFQFKPTVEYSRIYMDTLPKSALKMGCDVDYDAYTGELNRPPDQAQRMRTAGGHLHTGWCLEDVNSYDTVHFDMCRKAARQQDIVLRTGTLFFDKDGEEIKRRELYGKAGAFRPKPYGVEYRSLSNIWLKYDESIQWVFETTKRVMDLLVESKDLSKELSHLDLIREDNDHAREAFNKAMVEWGIPPLPDTLTELQYGQS